MAIKDICYVQTHEINRHGGMQNGIDTIFFF
jgi:hypothetical protein